MIAYAFCLLSLSPLKLSVSEPSDGEGNSSNNGVRSAVDDRHRALASIGDIEVAIPWVKRHPFW